MFLYITHAKKQVKLNFYGDLFSEMATDIIGQKPFTEDEVEIS
jgi:hypothetical protein